MTFNEQIEAWLKVCEDHIPKIADGEIDWSKLTLHYADGSGIVAQIPNTLGFSATFKPETVKSIILALGEMRVAIKCKEPFHKNGIIDDCDEYCDACAIVARVDELLGVK